MEAPQNPNQHQDHLRETPKAAILRLSAIVRKEKDRNPAVEAVLQLLALKYEMAKEQLVIAQSMDDVRNWQGEASATGGLLRIFTVAPPNLPKVEEYT